MKWTREEVLELVNRGDVYDIWPLLDTIYYDDEEIIKTVVKRCSHNLKYASIRLMDNEEIIKMAIKDCGLNLRYASSRLCDNEEIAKLAVNTSENALICVSRRLRNDRRFIMDLINSGKVNVYQLGKKFHNDRGILLKIVTSKYRYFGEYKYFDEELWKDYEILYHYVKKEGDLSYVPEYLHKLPDVERWLKVQVELKKGNELQLYHNDYDISISFF